MGDYAMRTMVAALIASAGVYAAWVHVKAGLVAESLPRLWKRVLPGLFYLVAALFLCNVVLAPGRLAAGWLPTEALQRARELTEPEKIMAAVLALAAAGVLVADMVLPVLRRRRSDET